jgi:hypothetical protein
MEILGYSILLILKVLFALFSGVLFTQSGLDKVFNYQGNLAYFESHFKASPLAPTVRLLLPTITLLETSAGLTSLVGVGQMLLSQEATLGFYGLLLGAVSLCCLFFGQRVAKDYGGAAALVPYFLMTTAGLAFYLAR